MIDNGFESFVQKDNFDQIVGFILEEWINNVLLRDTYDYNDYEDWLKRVEFKMNSWKIDSLHLQDFHKYMMSSI
jgi:hypothetical protein